MMQATTNLTRIGVLAAVVAGCTAASLPVGPEASSTLPESNVVGRMALVSENAAEETTPVTGRASLQVRFVSAGSPDRSAQYLPKAVKQAGSLKVFVSAGGKTYSGDYGRNPISQVPFSAIDLYGSIPSPQTVTFTDLPPGPATVTAYAYDAAGGYGNTAAEAAANVSLVSGNGNKVRLSFIRSGAPVLLGAYEQTGPSSTASVDAGPTGFDVTLNVTDILEPDVVGNIRIFVGGVEATTLTPSLTDAGIGRIQFRVTNGMTKGPIVLVNGGATASLQPVFTRISKFTIAPADQMVNTGGTLQFTGKAFDTNNAEFAPANPKIAFSVNADPITEPTFFSTDPQARRKLGTITGGGLYTAPGNGGYQDMVFYGIPDFKATTSVVIN